MRSCEKMAQLISESMERELTIIEKVEKKMHLMICEGCKNYEKNTLKLREITRMHNQQRPKK